MNKRKRTGSHGGLICYGFLRQSLTHQLYKHIYAHYEEMEVLNEMTDESLILDIDIIEKRHEEELAKVVAEKDKALAEAVAEVTAEKDKEIELLKQQLAQLKKG